MFVTFRMVRSSALIPWKWLQGFPSPFPQTESASSLSVRQTNRVRMTLDLLVLVSEIICIEVADWCVSAVFRVLVWRFRIKTPLHWSDDADFDPQVPICVLITDSKCVWDGHCVFFFNFKWCFRSQYNRRAEDARHVLPWCFSWSSHPSCYYRISSQ